MLRADIQWGSIHSAAMLAGGWTLLLAGFLSLPLPAPVSTPAMTIGGLLLARHSAGFRQIVATLRGYFPATSAAITRRSRNWPRAVRYVVLRTDPSRFGL